MKALVVDGKQARLDSHRRIPELRDDSILVRPMAIALNPTDWKHVVYGRAKDNCIIGCDYAGVVEAVGKAVTKSWSLGDRIFGCGHGSNYCNIDDGVFAEYAMVKGDLQMRMPDNLSFEKAATVGLGAITVGQGLYQKAMKLRLPTDSTEKNGIPVLIYGGASATGALAIQYAKLSGYTVITTCSPKNFDYVKQLGADAAFDYSEPNIGTKIRDYTGNQMKYAWDTISSDASAQICAAALSSTESGLKYGTLVPVESPRNDVETISTVMYTVFGKAFKFGDRQLPASHDDFEFGKIFFDVTEKLLAEGRLKTHTERVGRDGLQGALEGLQEMQAGRVRGEKLVYRLAETP
ncbi:zinc-binding oxidoreductase alcohol dehydrogenase [Lepidopterella palustris CBS 459.81]|uniref:Zinc-binding oxidoreductase alcohol dehydrogenase n=1 Tax=Lepidopterella palustris CBS 459.81 TaxID=1314670 RepID=A0A8E2JBY2_9PEZI|nr:zinc-binding oxidoreductase alcohol dehydrogenase [Lepidopterella palustris CBS 459.81]